MEEYQKSRFQLGLNTHSIEHQDISSQKDKTQQDILNDLVRPNA